MYPVSLLWKRAHILQGCRHTALHRVQTVYVNSKGGNKARPLFSKVLSKSKPEAEAMADAEVCTPTDGIYCPGCAWHEGTCYNGGCEGLHEEADVRKQQAAWKIPDRARLIIAAGPERSGSTWLFNAIRILLQEARQPLDPFWVTSLSQHALAERGAGQPNRPHVLVKTHRWSDDWDPSTADLIFLTHRDLRAVLASYQRVGWTFHIPDSYVAEHMRWQGIADHDFAYEDILGKPHEQMEVLASLLGVKDQVDISRAVERVNALKPPRSGPPDPVTKLWPRHISKETQQQQQQQQQLEQQRQSPAPSQQVGRKGLKERFPEYFQVYGYD